MSVNMPITITDLDRRYIASAESLPWWRIQPAWAETDEARNILEDMATAKFNEERASGKYDTSYEGEEE